MWNSSPEDLGCDFGWLVGSNPAIEEFPWWLDLSPSRSLYIGCMGSWFSWRGNQVLAQTLSCSSAVSPTILGGGTTQIFHESKASPWAREKPLIMPKANTPLGFMVIQLSQYRHIKDPLKCQPHSQLGKTLSSLSCRTQAKQLPS